MSEVSRFIRGLQYIGWTDAQINQFILYVEEGGDEKEKLYRLKKEFDRNSTDEQ